MIPPYDEQNWWQRMIADALYAALFIASLFLMPLLAVLIWTLRLFDKGADK